MVAQYIIAQPIMDLCEETLQIPGTGVAKMWWEQEVLDLSVVRAVASAE